MTNFVNYDTILTDFVNAVTGANLGFQKVLKDASDFDFNEANMPLADCRFKRVDPENTAGQNYYVDATLEVEIACFNMTSRAACCKMRNDLTNALQDYVRRHQRFSGNVDSTVVGRVDFESGETKTQGEFVAAAVAQFHVKLYAENI